MKKILIVLIALIAFVYIFSGHAVAEESVVDQLEDSLSDQLENLDFSDFDNFINKLEYDGFREGVQKFIESIINGNGEVDVTGLIKTLGDGVVKELFGFLPVFLSIILISVLSSTLGTFSSKIAQNATESIVRFVCLAGIVVLLLTVILGAVDSVKNTVGLFGEFINVAFPILITLLSVIGGGSAVGVFSPYVGILSTFILNFVQTVIIPAFLACLTLSIVGYLTKSIKLTGIRKFIKSASEYGLGAIFGLFCTILGAQSIVSSSFNAISIKTTKFALSSYVPILGGYLSDGFDVVIAGSILIKNALGLTGVVIILLIILLPLIKLIVLSLALKLTSGIVESFSSNGISEMLNSISSSIKILISVLLGIAFITFFTLLLMIYTFNAGVL